jgi:hypothetical protein
MAKTDKGWAVPNYIVRVHIPSRQAMKINLVDADTMEPLAYLEPYRRTLLIREKDDSEYLEVSAGPEHTGYYLLDAETGHANQTRETSLHSDMLPIHDISIPPYVLLCK